VSKQGMKQYDVIRVATKLLVPFILLFALYVQFHGDFGPGGGFQAGVIFSAGILLFAVVFGIGRVRKAIPNRALELVTTVGVFMYVGCGYVGLFQGLNFLNYDKMGSTPPHGQHWGIFTVELGVGITVAATMLSIFLAFARRRPS